MDYKITSISPSIVRYMLPYPSITSTTSYNQNSKYHLLIEREVIHSNGLVISNHKDSLVYKNENNDGRVGPAKTGIHLHIIIKA